MQAKKRELPPGGGQAPKNTVNQMKAQSGAKHIANAVGANGSGKGLSMIKGAVTCPNGGGSNSRW